MSVPAVSGAYGLGPDEGEGIWFNGGLGLIKASTESTDGHFFAMEVRGLKGFAAPLHVHRNEDEFFVVLDGEVRIQHGDEIFEATSGALVYGPRDVPHSFHIDSDEARLLLVLAPSGMEGFFREVGEPADGPVLPPPGNELPDREILMEIGNRYRQEFVGPPLPPKD